MTTPFSVLDVVALLTDAPDHGLVRGQVGTIVEQLDDAWFDVDFCDDAGRSDAQAAFSAHALLQLFYRPLKHAL